MSTAARDEQQYDRNFAGFDLLNLPRLGIGLPTSDSPTTFRLEVGDGTTAGAFRVDSSRNVVINNAILAVGATEGYFMMTRCAGTPVGVPNAAYTAINIPLQYDATNDILYAYNAGWKAIGGAGFVTGTGATPRLAYWSGTSSITSDAGYQIKLGTTFPPFVPGHVVNYMELTHSGTSVGNGVFINNGLYFTQFIEDAALGITGIQVGIDVATLNPYTGSNVSLYIGNAANASSTGDASNISFFTRASIDSIPKMALRTAGRLHIREAGNGESGGLTIGSLTTATFTVNLIKSQNAGTVIHIANVDGGASAQAAVQGLAGSGTPNEFALIARSVANGNRIELQSFTAPELRIRQISTGFVSIYTADIHRLSVLTGGNVGIGSTANTATTTLDIRLPSGATANTTGLQLAAGSATAVSDATSLRLRYNQTTGTFQGSFNTAAYVDFLTGTAGASGITGTGTATRITFWSGASTVSSSANLFWDNTLFRIGNGTSTPSAQYHQKYDGAEIGAITTAVETVRHERTTQTGTPGVGYGIIETIYFQQNAGVSIQAGEVRWLWTAVGAASTDHASSVRFSTKQAAGIADHFLIGNWIVASAAGAVGDVINFNGGTITVTGTTAITNVEGFNYALFTAPTITDASAVTITHSATVAISGPPIPGGSVTITNLYSLWVRAGNVLFAGNLDVTGTLTTGDLRLRDEERSADWILREETDFIRAVNKRTGKHYRVAMEEISEDAS